MVLAGVALERYVLVAPSLAPTRLLLNPIPLFGGLLFLGLLMLSVLVFLSRYSPISSAEAAFREIDEAREGAE
jgi:hypothetical protein